MIVCVCNNVNEEKIVQIIKNKTIKSIEDLQMEISICDQCQTCEKYINFLIKSNNNK
jgi:bacterioferritin-associated ferredoxin